MSDSSGSVPKPKLPIGDVVGGEWKVSVRSRQFLRPTSGLQVLSELGRGGCGIVYRVERLSDGLQAALKAETVDEKYTQTLKAEVLQAP